MSLSHPKQLAVCRYFEGAVCFSVARFHPARNISVAHHPNLWVLSIYFRPKKQQGTELKMCWFMDSFLLSCSFNNNCIYVGLAENCEKNPEHWIFFHSATCQWNGRQCPWQAANRECVWNGLISTSEWFTLILWLREAWHAWQAEYQYIFVLIGSWCIEYNNILYLELKWHVQLYFVT